MVLVNNINNNNNKALFLHIYFFFDIEEIFPIKAEFRNLFIFYELTFPVRHLTGLYNEFLM
jgi:hypothetical protein